MVITPHTILRLRGSWFAAFNAATVSQDEARITAGVCVVSTDAAAVGSSAMPDPASDADYPWLWIEPISMFSPFVLDGTAADNGGHLPMYRGVIDSKAMRKIKPNQSLAWILQYQDVTGTPAVRVGAATRVLTGEP